MTPSPSEFELIARYFSRTGRVREDVLLSVGDDAALVAASADAALAMAVDTLVADVHFDTATPAQAVGHKALAVNLSDLAAMGAEPQWCLLALTLPRADASWLEGFARGLGRLAERFGVALVGGDTTRGPLSVTVTVLGRVPAATALRRDGARPGDLLYVSGTLGDAACALALDRGTAGAGAAAGAALHRRLHFPEPRVALGGLLRGFASAAIDVSDGLAADVGHMLAASGVGARIDAGTLPLSAALTATCAPEQALHLALTGGDDYELCFALPAAQEEALARRLAGSDVSVTRIGVVRAGSGLELAGVPPDFEAGGYRHF
ncbi:MAG: thiamine-phosphate kinase [Gammaproteobacteria bacterium]|nr:thiamine-phosphate kinase [Gammaproteobacteria bacterium]